MKNFLLMTKFILHSLYNSTHILCENQYLTAAVNQWVENNTKYKLKQSVENQLTCNRESFLHVLENCVTPIKASIFLRNLFEFDLTMFILIVLVDQNAMVIRKLTVLLHMEFQYA